MLTLFLDRRAKKEETEKLPVCLYLRTYKDHLPWLPWLFRSINKYFPNPNETVIAFPEQDAPDIAEVRS